jgi:hypothetical protein
MCFWSWDISFGNSIASVCPECIAETNGFELEVWLGGVSVIADLREAISNL